MPDPPSQGDRSRRPRLSRRLRIAILAAIVVVIVVDAYLLLKSRDDGVSYDGADAPAFSFTYDSLQRARAEPGELVRLEERPEPGEEPRLRVTVEPLRFSPSAEPVGGTLPLAADRLIAETQRGLRRFRLLEEGRTRLRIMDGLAAYQFGYTAKPADPPPEGRQKPREILIGKSYLIPEEADRADRGVVLTLLQRTSDQKTKEAVREAPAGFFLNWPIRFWLQLATAVDAETPLERPVKSFEFE